MKVLITAPSLNINENVSGISTVVNSYIQYDKENEYFHYQLGSQDTDNSAWLWILRIIKQISFFPFFAIRHKVNIVHQNLPFDPKGVSREFVINIMAKCLGIPVILHIHGGHFMMSPTEPAAIYKLLIKIMFRNSAAVLVLSEVEREYMEMHYKGTRTIVLRNCVNIDVYKNLERKSIGAQSHLLFIGRIHDSKGVDDILATLKLLKKDNKFFFHLCGTGPLKDMLVKECKDLLGNDFIFHGIVDGKEKIQIIQEADLFLLPSRYGEGLPMALLETMAAGVVPLVTDDASMRFVVKHMENGMIVQKKNPVDLYDKLKLLLNDAALFGKLSEKAARTIEENFDIKDYFKKLNSIYNNAITLK